MTETGIEVAETTKTSSDKKNAIRQSVAVRDAGPCKKHITVTVEAAELKDRFEAKLKELSDDAQVNGFRHGKAPRRLIENRYKKEISEQLKNELLYQSLEQMSEDKKLNPISPPNIDPNRIEIPLEGDFVYEFEVEVRPEFNMPEYKGLKLNKPVHHYTSEEIAREERRILATYGTPLPKEEAVALEDMVILSGPVKYGEQQIGMIKSHPFRVDGQLAFKDGVAPKFAEQVVGKKTGDTIEVEIVLQQSLSVQELRGQTVKGFLTIEKVLEVPMPELNDEFLGQFGLERADEFRELVEALLKRRLEHAQRQVARTQFMSFIGQEMNWELPRDLLMKQARTAMARRVMEMRADGIPEDEIVKRQRLLSQDILKSTEQALKEHFVLQRVAESEKIEVEEGDIEEEIRRIAAREGESYRKVRARMEKDDLIDALAAEILERKAVDLIMDNAEFVEVPLEEAAKQAPDVHASEAQAVSGSEVDPAAEEIPST
jgi:trigger factor